MKNNDPHHVKTVLTVRQQELTAQKESAGESAQTVSLDQSSVGRLSRMDALQSQQMALESRRRLDIQLNRVKAALERIENGEYGYCASCGEEINRRRLEVDPANPFCVDCAERM